MVKNAIPDSTIYIPCPNCDDVTEHEVLKGNWGKGNVTGTFRCGDCGRVFSASIRIPESRTVKILFSDGDVTNGSETTLESDEVVTVDDEFYLDDGRRVCVTHIDVESGKNVRRAQADVIKRLWVKQFDVLTIKVSVNEGQRTHSLRVEADPDEEFPIGTVLGFDDFDALVHAIKTKDKLINRGSAEARDIVRIYGKIRRKEYSVLDDDSEDHSDIVVDGSEPIGFEDDADQDDPVDE
ncbi:MAG: hypothetical protein LBV63_01685 [Candidatus Methanoplasma sp.]|jgi:uncharacterized Zn finger protein|nr:hypothetical protein [Candidatus Methanoplasma sp.]